MMARSPGLAATTSTSCLTHLPCRIWPVLQLYPIALNNPAVYCSNEYPAGPRRKIARFRSNRDARAGRSLLRSLNVIWKIFFVVIPGLTREAMFFTILSAVSSPAPARMRA